MIIHPNLLLEADTLLLLEKMETESVHLVYLDPPWASNAHVSDVETASNRTFIYRVIQQAHRVLNRLAIYFYTPGPT